MCLCFTGAHLVYIARFESITFQSSTETEFVGAVEAGKLALYIRSILDNLGITQESATPLYEESTNAAIAISNTIRLTSHTHHMDIKYFALMAWVATDQLVFMSISNHDNPTNELIKSLGPYLFRRNSTTLLGKRKSIYCNF